MTLLRNVLTAICLAVLSVTGSTACTHRVQGAAFAAPGGHRSVPGTAGPVPRGVPVAALDSMLLSREQAVAVVGGADLAPVNTITNTSDSSQLIDDRACLGLASVGDVTVYTKTGWVGMRGNQFSTPHAVAADVTQLVTSFTTGADAGALLQRAREDWQGCATRRYGFHSSNGNHSNFDTGALTVSDTRIELTMRQSEDPRWGCTHGMTVRKTIVAEARVCLLGGDTAAALNDLLDQLVDRIPQ